jgi:hypothetical protein
MQNAIKLENIGNLITSPKNAFNPYNSVTKYFLFICFENLPLVIPSTHTYIPLMCVGHEKQNALTLFSYIDN